MLTKPLSILLVTLYLLLPQKHTTVYLIGDSTMANKQPNKFPETGWGMPFSNMFNADVTIDNRAMNGRSTKSFMNEKRWQPIVDALKEGDYVFIQFGHNDEKIDKPEVGTSIEVFKTNLIKYITETRAAKANPILLTPVNRWKFDSLGHFQDTHGAYPDAVREVAKTYNVPLIDMYQKSKILMENIGAEASHKWFNQLEKGEHPNYPEGIKDNTHFNAMGAQQMADLAVEGLKELHIDLYKQLVNNK
ncbi:rhamnogalacturonan acetylesterase [Parasediminibacterium paludis]|uniref:Rhamnogalacturonan acetylesterase n=1 Tax=Parasediminibacterium paludis TaxID=908966 RepID=A0ABV8PT18_9BACT